MGYPRHLPQQDRQVNYFVELMRLALARGELALHPGHVLAAPRQSVEALARVGVGTVAPCSQAPEPVEDLLLTDADGRPTIETRTTADLERSLRLPGGNIFHGPLAWPWADDDAPLGTAAERWGVATAHERILLCGSGAVRGGAVSGLGGHNAAMAVLEYLLSSSSTACTAACMIVWPDSMV